MIHAAADTPHPVRQGLWGSFEVFVDTILVCTITAMAILSTGVWKSGLTSATLTIEAYKSVFGKGGLYFIGIITLLFGLTKQQLAGSHITARLLLMASETILSSEIR